MDSKFPKKMQVLYVMCYVTAGVLSDSWCAVRQLVFCATAGVLCDSWCSVRQLVCCVTAGVLCDSWCAV